MGLFNSILDFVISLGGLLKKKGNISDYLMLFLTNLPALLEIVKGYKDVEGAEKIDEAIAAVKEKMLLVDLDRDMPPEIEAEFIACALRAAEIAMKHGIKDPAYYVKA
jgi:hypothetical protein